jgi:hypothetical protein
MNNREDAYEELKRLQLQLQALAGDLDAVELRQQSLLRNVGTSEGDPSSGIEGFVDRFALAMRKGNAG